MIIQVIDIGGVLTFESKYETPVSVHCDSPKIGQIPLQRM
jgi:hypothetical protein